MKPDFYKIYATLNAAKTLTGNEVFAELIATVKDMEKLLAYNNHFLSSFPVQGESYGQPPKLEEKIKERMKITQEWINHVREMNK